MKWLYFIYSEDIKGDKNRLLKNYLARKKIHYTILLLKDDEKEISEKCEENVKSDIGVQLKKVIP